MLLLLHPDELSGYTLWCRVLYLYKEPLLEVACKGRCCSTSLNMHHQFSWKCLAQNSHCHNSHSFISLSCGWFAILDIMMIAAHEDCYFKLFLSFWKKKKKWKMRKMRSIANCDPHLGKCHWGGHGGHGCHWWVVNLNNLCWSHGLGWIPNPINVKLLSHCCPLVRLP